MSVVTAGKYALEGMLPAQQQQAVFKLFDFMSAAWRKSIKRSDLSVLQRQGVEALHLFECAFPCSMQFIKTHNVVHMVDKIAKLGPLYITSMFPYERSYKQLKAWVLNQKTPEASLMQNIRACMVAVGYMAAGGDSIGQAVTAILERDGRRSSLLSPYQQVSQVFNKVWLVCRMMAAPARLLRTADKSCSLSVISPPLLRPDRLHDPSRVLSC
jgi:hypothetical protein